MPYDRYGEWYDATEGPIPEIIAEYTYEDMAREVPPPPPDYGDAIGYDNRIISRKPGQSEYLTIGGNEPLPDYFQSGGYKGKPDDPHLDADVIYYPDEVHTKKEGGGWDIAKRTPPGRKPTDTDLSEMEFLKFSEPEIMKDATAFGKDLRKQWEDSIPYSDRVLMKPAEFAVKGAEIEKLATNEKRNEMVASLSYDFRRKRALEDKTPNEIELTRDALRGDRFAQETLDAIQKRKEDATTAAVDRKDKGLDVPALAKAVADGQDAPMAIKGSMGNPLAAKVKSEVLKQYPKFDFQMADANYKWKQSATNQRTVNFAGGALPRLGALDDQLTKLDNADINVINKVMAAVSKQFGKPEYTNYESNRNAIVQEIGTALSGTSQASDLRLKIELENLESAKSPAQIRGAISNLREALIARLDVDLSPLYPIEVVRGEKSLGKYKADMFKKFRGNYGKYGEGVNDTSSATVYIDNGKRYNIPPDKEAAFLKARPNAKRGR